MSHNVFVYGTLKRGFGNNRLLPEETFVAETTTDDATYTLLSYGAFPFVSPYGDHKVHGELYSVDDETLQQLDYLEGHPRFYCREVVKVDGQDAWMYMIREPDSHYDQNNIVEISEGVLVWR